MTVYFRNLRLEMSEHVYEPAEDSFLLAENLDVREGERVLDMGTGTGIIALTAAEEAGKVLGADVNPHAVKLAGINAGLNGIGNADFAESDLFDRVSGTFDLITFNPPYLPLEDVSPIGRAWAGGNEGRDVIEAFIKQLGVHLNPHGRIQLLASSLNDINKVIKLFKAQGFKAEITAQKRLFFEEIYVITAKTGSD